MGASPPCGSLRAIPPSSLRPAEPWHRDTRASELQLHVQAGKQTRQQRGFFRVGRMVIDDSPPPPPFFPLLIMFHFIRQESRNAISNEKIKPFCFNTLPAQHPHAPAHLHSSFSPKHSPGPADPISRQRSPLAGPISQHPASPGSPAPSPIPPSTSPLHSKHIFFPIHHVAVDVHSGARTRTAGCASSACTAAQSRCVLVDRSWLLWDGFGSAWNGGEEPGAGTCHQR